MHEMCEEAFVGEGVQICLQARRKLMVVFKALALPSLLRCTMLCYRMKDKADGLTQRNIDLVEAEEGCGYVR